MSRGSGDALDRVRARPGGTHEGLWVCPLCATALADYEDLQVHMVTLCPSMRLLERPRCQVCGCEVEQGAAFDEHVRRCKILNGQGWDLTIPPPIQIGKNKGKKKE